jgi:hypothetical protein
MRTQGNLEELCRLLQENMGDMYKACRAIGVSLQFVNAWRKDDPKVDEAVVEACNFGHMGLYTAAVQRAVHGVERPVYYKGEVVGHETEYSDGLLRRLLDVKLPEFKKDADDASRVTVNIANIMPRADNYEQWLQMKNITIDQKALPSPEPSVQLNIEEAVFEPVTPFKGIEL